jgi:hypothetical protein
VLAPVVPSVGPGFYGLSGAAAVLSAAMSSAARARPRPRRIGGAPAAEVDAGDHFPRTVQRQRRSNERWGQKYGDQFSHLRSRDTQA